MPATILPRFAVVLLLAASLLHGQTFEAASLKRAADEPVKGDAQETTWFTPAGLTMRNVTLRDMIVTAYGIRDHQLVGPAWMKSDRYDLTAKAAEAAPPARMRTMLQAMLAERFQLTVHRDTRDFAVDALVAGKSAPKLGSKKTEGASKIGIDKGRMLFQNFSMTRLADYLSQRSPDRPVVDATEIDGYYDFTVPLVEAESDNPADVKRAMGQAMRDGTLARMVAEQLGLRLETRKGPTEIVVVDHAERTPTEK